MKSINEIDNEEIICSNEEFKKINAPVPPRVGEQLLKVAGLEGLASMLPTDEVLSNRIDVLDAISDHNRLKILNALAICDLCPCLLIELLGLSNSRLTYHLKILERGNLISQYSEGNWRVYHLTEFGCKVNEWIKRSPIVQFV